MQKPVLDSPVAGVAVPNSSGELLSQLYLELRHLAARRLAHEKPDPLLQHSTLPLQSPYFLRNSRCKPGRLFALRDWNSSLPQRKNPIMNTLQHSTRWLGLALAGGRQHPTARPGRRSPLCRALALVVSACLVVPSLALAKQQVVVAGPDREIELGLGTLLVGITSDADTIAWQWNIEAAPVGSSPYLATPTESATAFIPDKPGEYIFSLMVSDGRHWSEPDFVTVTVYEILPPVALATSDVTTGPDPLTVNFDGSASTVDPHVGTLTYSWNFGDSHSASGPVATHTYFQPGTYTAELTVVDSRGQADIDYLVITITPGGNIQVSPGTYDFGDVKLGSSGSTLITLINPMGGTHEEPLVISTISLAVGSSPAFAVSGNYEGYTLLPGESVDVEVVITPSATGYAAATLEITSDDPVFPLIGVPLGGMGVSVEQPPQEQVALILAFMDAALAEGSLTGEGPGASAGNRLNALQNMIEASGDLIAGGAYEEACGQLAAALQKCDGQPSPPDFVSGEAALVLKLMIEELRSSLGCD